MELKPQDIVVALKLVALDGENLSMQKLGVLLGLSSSRIHESLHRLNRANLSSNMLGGFRPMKANLEEFLLHGIKYAFVPEIGEFTRGIPTASYAPPLNNAFADSNEPPYVWPDAEGEVRGVSFSPLHKCVPKAIRQDQALYELLALVDAIRAGRARDRKMAAEEISKRLSTT
ncbi:MAG: hypothetical protein Q9M30_02190 [Mariprofundaceae bacterium]|nr:hypothetical protein [Mariprofundaceae bacterium]